MNRLALLVLAFLTLALPASAVASPDQIFEDCQDGRLDRSYSSSDLREAIRDLPVDLDEYSNCREIIRSAQQGVLGPGGSGPKQGDTGPIVGQGNATDGLDQGAGAAGGSGGSGGGATGSTGQAQTDAGGKDYGLLQPGQGGLPRNGNSAANPLDFGASAEERQGFEQARLADPAQLASAAGENPRTSGADLPTALIILLLLTGGAVGATLVPRLKDLVVRRSA